MFNHQINSSSFSSIIPAVPMCYIDNELEQQRLIDSNKQSQCYCLLAHADLFYNLKGSMPLQRQIPEMVKWQLLFAARSINDNGSTTLYKYLSFSHLEIADLALFYTIIHCYNCAPNASHSFTQLLQYMETYFRYLSCTNPQKSHALINELRHCGAQHHALINKLETQIKTIQLQPHNLCNNVNNRSAVLNANKTPHIIQHTIVNELFNPQNHVSQDKAVNIKALMETEPTQIISIGSTARVFLYDDIALKVYHQSANELESKSLNLLFQKELAAYQLMGDSQPNFKFWGYDQDNMIIAMTRLKGDSALKMLLTYDRIDEKTDNATNSMSQLMKWIAGFHEISLTKVLTEGACYKDLERLNPEIDTFSAFKSDIQMIGNLAHRQAVTDSFDRFLNRKTPSALFLAHCNNDVSFHDFYPLENVLIDFNASGISPIARDVATALVNFYLQTGTSKGFELYNSGAVKAILTDAIKTYEATIQARHPDFTLDVSLVRQGIAHFLLRRSCHEAGNPDAQQSLQSKVIRLLDSTDEHIESALECLLSYDQAGYWCYLLGNAIAQANKATHSSLLKHAEMRFNLSQDLYHSPLPQQVVWQILFASQSEITENGKVELHKDFGVKHLTTSEHALLYCIINSYINENIQSHVLDAHAVSLGKALLSYCEEQVIALGKKSATGFAEFISTLKQFDDKNLQSSILRLETTQKG